MIDLTTKKLPHQVRCDDGWVEVETDFRAWLRFGKTSDPRCILKSPCMGWEDGALEFLKSENVCPKGGGGGGRVFDYTIDSELLVAAFMQAYGIDLTTCDMHWHVFLALLRGLPEDTRLVQVMGYRAWKKTHKKTDDVYAELKQAWALPMSKEEKQAALEWQQSMFGGFRCPTSK